MGDEKQYQSNSGHAACEITRGGKRTKDIQAVIDVVGRYPNIDSFTISFVQAGGDLVQQNGQWHLKGKTHELTADQLAKVIKTQARVNDAFKRGFIVEASRLVNRPVKSTGYKVAGNSGYVAQAQKIGDEPKPKMRKVSEHKPPQPGQYGKFEKPEYDRGPVVGMPDYLKEFKGESKE